MCVYIYIYIHIKKLNRTNQHEDTTPQKVGRAGRPVLRQRSEWKVSGVQKVRGHPGQFLPWLVKIQLCLLMMTVTTEQNVELIRGKFIQCFTGVIIF